MATNFLSKLGHVKQDEAARLDEIACLDHEALTTIATILFAYACGIRFPCHGKT